MIKFLSIDSTPVIIQPTDIQYLLLRMKLVNVYFTCFWWFSFCCLVLFFNEVLPGHFEISSLEYNQYINQSFIPWRYFTSLGHLMEIIQCMFIGLVMMQSLKQSPKFNNDFDTLHSLKQGSCLTLNLIFMRKVSGTSQVILNGESFY